jgi:hypothetical protein
MEVIAQYESVKSLSQIILFTVLFNYLKLTLKYYYRNKIYVIGGDYDMSCEVYDIKENKWSFISSYNTLLGNSLYSFSSAIAISD